MVNFVCDSKYLKFPVNDKTSLKSITFYSDEGMVLDLDIRLDYVNPDFYTYVNVERFQGHKLSAKIHPEMKLEIEKTDTPYENPSMYESAYRPGYHFTALNGWINDPNGFYFLNGEYHLFHQYNPVSCKWGNMHWGHAVSKNLIHWEHLDSAVYPTRLGTAFSGSAFIDFKNDSGLQENENPPILLFYTAAGGSRLSEGEKFTQCICYSTDGGKTFRQYEKNPILKNLVDGNRDPKIEYDFKSGNYVMALYLDKNDFGIFVSKNLLNWRKTQVLTISEEAECPDFYPLKANGKVKWVFSGACDRYLIGDFDGEVFRPDSEPRRLHYGNASYAAQTCHNAPDGKRIRIAWNSFEIPEQPFRGQMTFPCEMSLKGEAGAEYLTINPLSIISEFYKETKTLTQIPLSQEISEKLDGLYYDIFLELSDITGEIDISVFGAVLKISDNSVRFNDCVAPLYMEKGKAKLRLLIDKASLEVFIGDGRAHMALGHLMDYNLKNFTVKGNGTAQKVSISKIQP